MLYLEALLELSFAILGDCEGDVAEVQDGGHNAPHAVHLRLGESDHFQRCHHSIKVLIVIDGSHAAALALK